MVLLDVDRKKVFTVVQENIKFGGKDHEPKTSETKVSAADIDRYFTHWIVGMLSDGGSVSMGTRNGSPVITAKTNVVHVGEVVWFLWVKEDQSGVRIKRFLTKHVVAY